MFKSLISWQLFARHEPASKPSELTKHAIEYGEKKTVPLLIVGDKNAPLYIVYARDDAGSFQTSQHMLTELATRLNARIYAPDYPIYQNESETSGLIDDSIQIMERSIVRAHTDASTESVFPETFLVMGKGQAGTAIATAAMVECEKRQVQVDGLLLISPWATFSGLVLSPLIIGLDSELRIPLVYTGMNTVDHVEKITCPIAIISENVDQVWSGHARYVHKVAKSRSNALTLDLVSFKGGHYTLEAASFYMNVFIDHILSIVAQLNEKRGGNDEAVPAPTN